MEMIKEILIDSFNGFSVRMIPLFLLQLIFSGLLAYVFQWLFKKKTGSSQKDAVPLTMAIALITSIVKYSLPFAVLGGALIMMLGARSNRSSSELFQLLILGIIGVGCGVGSIVQTTIGFVLLCVILIFTPLVKSDENQS
jgi:hypothetical protein